jgi:peptidoglycan-associated lipoprotein
MNLKHLGVLLAVVALASGCSCKRKMEGMGNIAMAEAGKNVRDINFGFDSYSLDSSSKAVLDGNVAYLKENPSITAQIEGHCDERGTNEYNMVLGVNRAKAVMDYVVASGLASNRFTTVSYGEEVPLDPAHTEEAWAANRRAHFAVSGN